MLAGYISYSQDNIAMCINFITRVDHLSNTIDIYLSGSMAVFQIIMNSVLLYMFIKRLWAVNKVFIEMFAKEYCDIPGRSQGRIGMGTVFDSLDEQSVSRKLHEESISRSRKSIKETAESAKHILKLHDIIKKQTILVSISMISSVLVLILIVFVDVWIALQIHWDVIVNAICVWLMLGSSQRYWLFCTKTCVRCCYLKENMILKQQKMDQHKYYQL